MSEELTSLDGEINNVESDGNDNKENLNKSENENQENQTKEEEESQVVETNQTEEVNKESDLQPPLKKEEGESSIVGVTYEGQDNGTDQNPDTTEDIKAPDNNQALIKDPSEKSDVEQHLSSEEIPKVVDDLVSNIDDVPMEDTDLEKLDARLTPPSQQLSDEENENDMENSSNFGEGAINEINDSDFATYDREQLLQQYKEALEERARIQQLNQQYQHKLAEYFKKKKTDDKTQEIEKNVTDQEQRYLKYMSNLEELQAAEARQANSIELQLEELKEKCQEKQNKVEEASTSFMTFKYEIAKNSINSRTGKPIPQKDLEQYQLAEQKKENEVIAVRLENIKLKNRLKKREQQLKAKEELAEGLHLIDFEQLKIENQTYNEKIEERNEELLKLRKKINSTVQVLTHLKEKLQHVQGENAEQRSNLRDIDSTVAKKRDLLTRLKQSRDSLRFDNSKLKHKAGLLGNKPLLQDFELRKDESEELREKLAELKERHLGLNLTLNGVRKKIESAKGMR